MSIFEPESLTPQEAHEYDFWEREECYKFYVRERRRNCTFMQLMDLWLRAPYCSSCAAVDPSLENRPADIYRNWRRDMGWKLGESTLRMVLKARRSLPGFVLICKNCGANLRPWNNDEIWIMNYHLEEHYDLPLEIPGRKSVSKKVRKSIIARYGNACFGCGSTNRLHMDHILPQSKGGTSAFRNLQPLCTACGNLKGNALPDEVDVYSDIYFGPYPSDGYEGLFW